MQEVNSMPHISNMSSNNEEGFLVNIQLKKILSQTIISIKKPTL